MKFKRVIKNAIHGKSVVKKFDRNDLINPVQEVVYATNPIKALNYYYMQFVLRNYKYEEYHDYLVGTLVSKKVSNVFYYDGMEGYILRSSPYTGGEKWDIGGKKKRAVLPEKRKK